jgi:hypothetical protein
MTCAAAPRNMKRACIRDKVAMEISGHATRSVFDRYNIVDVADLRNAGERLEEYAQGGKQERAAPLQRVKEALPWDSITPAKAQKSGREPLQCACSNF